MPNDTLHVLPFARKQEKKRRHAKVTRKTVDSQGAVLLLQEVEAAVEIFKQGIQRDANRCLLRHNPQGALAALQGAEYVDEFLFELRLLAGRKRSPAPIQEGRDAEWTRVALEITDKVFTPEQAAKWLARDREIRAQHVNAARQRRGPVRW